MSGNHKLSNLIRKEDWLSVWIGAIIIIIGCVAVLTGWFDFSALSFIDFLKKSNINLFA